MREQISLRNAWIFTCNHVVKSVMLNQHTDEILPDELILLYLFVSVYKSFQFLFSLTYFFNPLF